MNLKAYYVIFFGLFSSLRSYLDGYIAYSRGNEGYP